MKKIRALWAVVLLAVPAFAQNESVDQASRNPNAAVQTDDKAQQASDASKQAPPSGDDVTYEQVMAHPDDVELNEKWALTQIRKGDLRGAAITLERVLLVDPTRYRTRLLYGVVLVRLDDIADAAIELDNVLAVPDLPRAVYDEAHDYRKIAASRQRDSHYDARVTVGVGADSNRNAAPGDDVFFAGLPLILTPGSKRKADDNLQFIGALGASRDFGGPRGNTVFGRFTYYRSEQKVYDLLNLQVYSPKVGATVRTRWADLTPSFSFDHVLLSQSTYLRSRNIDFRVSRRWTKAWDGWFEFTHSDQDFVNTPRVTAAADRTGGQLDYLFGAGWMPIPTDRVSFSVLHRKKLARSDAEWGYRREEAGVEWLHLLGKGRFTVVSVTGDLDRYRSPDPLVLPDVTRHDDILTGQVLYGQPLTALWSKLRDFTGSVGYEYYRQKSNVMNYDYSNHKGTLLITYKWGI